MITLGEDAVGAVPVVTVNSPAIPARTWTYVKHSSIDFTSLDAYGTMAINPADRTSSGAATVYIDSIHAYRGDWNGQTWPLKVVDRKVLDKHSPSIDYITGSRPTVLAYSGKNFEIFRKPDGNYPIWLRYIKEPKEFIADGNYDADVADVENIDDVLIAGATWLGMSQRKKWDSAGHWEGRFRRALAEAMHADSNADGWEPVMRGFTRASGLDTSDLEVPVGENSITSRGDISGFYNIPI